MPFQTPPEGVDYLLIGHLTKDLTPDGSRLGGTAAYAGLTAHRLEHRVGLVTAWGDDLPLTPLGGLQITGLPGGGFTTFENQQTPHGRRQTIHHLAPNLDASLIPEHWRGTPIVHLGPVAGEVAPELANLFPQATVGATLQGWLRSWDTDGLVTTRLRPQAAKWLTKMTLAVLSLEDVGGDRSLVEELAELCPRLVLTEGAAGATVYWEGEQRHFPAPESTEVDATGAGDIFAAAFFSTFHQTSDPWHAARFANRLAALSVTRPGLASIPHPEEIERLRSISLTRLAVG